MTTLTQVSKQLTIKDVDTDEDFVTTTYTCDVRADIAGDSIWDCTLTAADDVRITTICVTEGLAGGDYDSYRSVNVYYTVNGIEEFENSWTIYTDTGFADCVSELLGEEIYFTEQGMQEDGVASME
jgi:hypothetical protein